MDELKTRKPVFIEYYDDDDFHEISEQLPSIVEKAIKKADEVIVPTIEERKQIMEIIKKFIRDKERIVYGGTAVNEAIKSASKGEDRIYANDYTADIEFYSNNPVVDVVDLCNLLHEKGFETPEGREAQHEETYNLFVNFRLYCDITYVPVRVYRGIKTLVIDGIKYAHPHFIYIDQLRIFNQPLTAAEQRWMKTFPRMYKLLKYYKLEKFNSSIDLQNPTDEIKSYIDSIKDFLKSDKIEGTCLITGFKAYNYFILKAVDNNIKHFKNANSKVVYNKTIEKNLIPCPYLELISVSYKDSVEKIYNVLKNKVVDPSKLSVTEYFPLFQFTDYSIVISYDNSPIVKIFKADGFCVPNIKTTSKLIYVSYQYLKMYLLISKFRAHLDADKPMYFNYSTIFSNLILVRNLFLHHTRKTVINDTVFGEFKIACCGSTESYCRVSRLRTLEKIKNGGYPFRYNPESFFSQTAEKQQKFDPHRAKFKNTSGNIISNPKNRLFNIDESGNIVCSSEQDVSSDDKTELERVVSSSDEQESETPVADENNQTTETEIVTDVSDLNE